MIIPRERLDAFALGQIVPEPHEIAFLAGLAEGARELRQQLGLWQQAATLMQRALCEAENTPVRYYKEGRIVYAVYGSSSIDYVERLRRELRAIKELP